MGPKHDWDGQGQAEACETFEFDFYEPRFCKRTHPTHGESYQFVESVRNFNLSRRVVLGNTSTCTIEMARKGVEQEIENLARQRKKKPRPLYHGLKNRAALAEYEKEYPTDAFEMSRSNFFLLVRMILPRFGDCTPGSVGHAEWKSLVESILIRDRKLGEHFYKILKHFLKWSVKHGLLRIDPLADYTLYPALRPYQQPTFLGLKEVLAIYGAATQVGEPWHAIVGLSALTSEPIEYVQDIEAEDIDWENKRWVGGRERTSRFRGPHAEIKLPLEAMSLLEPFKVESGRLFVWDPARRRSQLASFNEVRFTPEVFEKLKAISGIRGEWSMRDIRQTVYREISRRGGGDEGVTDWCRYFFEESEKSCVRPNAGKLSEVATATRVLRISPAQELATKRPSRVVEPKQV